MKKKEVVSFMYWLFLMFISTIALPMNTATASQWSELRDAIVQDALQPNMPAQPAAAKPAVAPTVPAAKTTWNNHEYFNTIELNGLRKNHQSATWVDAATQLMWTSCLYGREYKRGQCGAESEDIKGALSWHEARLVVGTLNYLDYQDWRLPTRAELATILHCEDGYGAIKPLNEGGCSEQDWVVQPPYFSTGSSGMWTAEAVKDNPAKGHRAYYWPGARQEAFANADAKSTAEFILVRGGTASAEYLASNEVAQKWAAEANDAQKRAQETAQNAQRIAQETAQKNAAMSAVEQAKLNAFRRSLHPGSKCGNGNGVVVEVKADIVRVETTQTVCRSYYDVANPLTGRRECRTTQVLPSGDVWLRRGAIVPRS